MWPIAETAGLSMGDRICLALALERDDEVLTSDRAWATVAHGAKVTLIR
jgi:PIN domain nuclease of toxin-antitoxin system